MIGNTNLNKSVVLFNMNSNRVKGTIDLSEITRDVIRIYEKPITAKQILLTTDFNEPIYVHSNKEISSIILRNALDNAIKYTRQDEIIIKIISTDEKVLLSIEDNGKGFDYKQLLHNLENTDPGTSQHLGFKIIHDLVIQLGVEYELKSEPGIGTRFSLKFPKPVPA